MSIVIFRLAATSHKKDKRPMLFELVSQLTETTYCCLILQYIRRVLCAPLDFFLATCALVNQSCLPSPVKNEKHHSTYQLLLCH